MLFTGDFRIYLFRKKNILRLGKNDAAAEGGNGKRIYFFALQGGY